MRKLVLIFLVLFLGRSYAINTTSSSAFHQVDRGLTVQSVTDGETLQLGHDSYLRTVFDKNDLGSWSVKLQIVDEDNVPVSDNLYQTSRKFFNNSVAVSFTDPLNVLDENGRERRVPAGTKLVRVEDVFNGGWKYYNLIMVNENGDMIDWNGNITNSPPVLKTSMGNYDNSRTQTHIQTVMSSLITEKEILEEKGNLIQQERPCIGCEDQVKTASELAPLTSSRPVARPQRAPASNAPFWSNSTTPFDLVMGRRDSLKRKRSCESDRRAYEEELLDQTSWGHLTIDQRAEKISQVAKESLDAIKEVSNDSGGRSNYANSVNANYFSPIITSDVVTCVAFQETSGALNPLMQNYTYCNNTRNMASTAHGLGQMTRGTFTKLKNHPDGDQSPYTTKYSQVLQGKSSRDAHNLLSTDPHLQLEVSLRLLNFEVKFAKWKNPRASDSELLKMAITAYDHDNKSSYVRKVFDQCIPCMKTKSAKDCYNESWD